MVEKAPAWEMFPQGGATISGKSLPHLDTCSNSTSARSSWSTGFTDH
jgi:hypothetical protein